MFSSILLLLPALVSAAATRRPSAAAGDACTFTDAAKAMAGKGNCNNIVLQDVAVPAGQTLDLTKLKDNTHVTFSGKTTFGYAEWKGPLISVSGNNILVDGAPGHVIDGDGKRWWDGKGGNGGKAKPKFFAAHQLVNSNIKGLNVLNTPVQAFSIGFSTNLGVYDVVLDNSAGDTLGGHNTDCFDVGSSNGVYISGANVKTQDDCLAINSGTNITFTNGLCAGGHGLSIGSVGGRSSNEVKHVRILNSKITDSDNGVRIKTVSGATGSVSDVVYENITLSNIAKYGCVVEQDYLNGGPTGTPTDGVPITDITISNVKGTVKSGGTNVYILCAACSNWKWTNNDITGGAQSKKNVGVPPGVNI